MGVGARALLLVPTLGLIFVASQFHRASTAVIAPELSRELGLGSAALGAMSGAFFIAFAAAQLPTGILLDRFGPRRTNLCLLALAVAGALLFALAPSVPFLIASRVMLGLGCAGVLMGSIMTLARWFPPDRLATATGTMVALGGTGVLLATWPLALAAEAIGWRAAFAASAALTALLVVLLWAAVRDAPTAGRGTAAAPVETLGQIVRGLPRVWALRPVRYLFVVQMTTLSTTLTILGLWGGPYLAEIHGLAPSPRGQVLLAMSVATMLGNLAYGPLDRVFDARKPVVLTGGAIAVATLAALALLPSPPLALVIVLLVALAAFGAIAIVIQSHSRALLPDAMAGRGLTILNMGTMIGVATSQIVSGLIIGLFPAIDGARPEIAYRLVFAYLTVVLALGLIVYSRTPEVRPSQLRAGAVRAASR
ncbi:MAG: MFS transporter [Alphaproteobacteria bacterium]